MSISALPSSVTTRLSLFPGGERLLEEHAAELPQKNDLCGAFWGTLALRTVGYGATPTGGVLDQHAVAVEAGSTLPLVSHTEELPAGEPGRDDYRLEFPKLADGHLSGTAVSGVIRAVDVLSAGGLDAIPISGPFETNDVREIFRCFRAAATPGVVTLNVGTRYLWGAAADEDQLGAYLKTGDSTTGPTPDWDVGHFVGAAGTIEGEGGELILIADTYPSLGPSGLHLQPIECVAAALRRPEILGAGGVVLFLPPAAATEVREALTSAGLTLGLWDNGSPDGASGG